MTTHRLRPRWRDQLWRFVRYWGPPALVGIAWGLFAWVVQPGRVVTILLIAAAPISWVLLNFLRHDYNRQALARLGALIWRERREIAWQLWHGWRR